MTIGLGPDQTIGAVCSWPTLFASFLNSSVMLGYYLQQTTSADDIFRCTFFPGALRVKASARESLSLFVHSNNKGENTACAKAQFGQSICSSFL